MGKGFFKTNLANGGRDIKSTPGETAAEEKKKTARGEGAETAERAARDERRQAVALFDDVSVCQYLSCRRRVLNDARKGHTRGRDWDCVNLQAGMTKAWIDAYALKAGIVPNFNMPLVPIKADTTVVSVRLIGGHPSPGICLVERIADGTRSYARVRDQYQYPIHLHECFDAVFVNDHLEWTFGLNKVAY